MAHTGQLHGEALAHTLRRLQEQPLADGGDDEHQPPSARAQPSDSSDGRAHEAPSARGDVGEIYGENAPKRVPLPHASAPGERHQRDGYGFRPASGASTPLRATSTASPLPDPNGLGWPGGLLTPVCHRSVRTRCLSGSPFSSLQQRGLS